MPSNRLTHIIPVTGNLLNIEYFIFDSLLIITCHSNIIYEIMLIVDYT